MESAKDFKMLNQTQLSRQNQLKDWLTNLCGLQIDDMQSMPHDASFRRYYRIINKDKSFIAMDAPQNENSEAFIAIAKTLRQFHLESPIIYNADLSKGFLLLSDFGDDTYLRVLNDNNAQQLYVKALDALFIMHGIQKVENKSLSHFSADWMHQEWAWHKEWFLGNFLKLNLSHQEEQVLNHDYQILIENAISQPQVFMHRDYHSTNLMVLPHGVGILDFQDAFIGPLTYDLVSLLRDCYIAWPNELVEKWAGYYYQKLTEAGFLKNISQTQFLRWFDLMGIQRHLKALFTFARKKERDQQINYLQHIPRTFNYLISVSERYPELKYLSQYYHSIKERILSCVP